MISCQKETQLIKSSGQFNTSVNDKSLKLCDIRNIVTKEYLLKWLDEQTSLGQAGKNIRFTIGNLANVNIIHEAISSKEFLAIIPIKQNEILSNRDSNTVIENIILFIDSVGVISEAYLSKYFPDDQAIVALPENAISEFFAMQTISVDGTFELYNIDDIKQYEVDFLEGKKRQFRLWESRLAQPPGGINNGEVCIDWYLTTTVYGSNGEIIDYFESFLFTNCSSAQGGSAGQLPQIQEPDPVSVIRSFFVTRDVNRGYGILATYDLDGMKYRNASSLNYFTGINIREVSIGTATGATGSTSTSNPWAISWNQQSEFHTLQGSYQPKVAFATVTGVIWFPNQTGSDPMAVTNHNFWHAPQTL